MFVRAFESVLNIQCRKTHGTDPLGKRSVFLMRRMRRYCSVCGMCLYSGSMCIVCVCVGVKICPDGGPTVQPWGPPVISHKPHAHAHNHHTHTTVARPNWRTGGTQGCLSVRHLGSTQGKDLEKMRTKEFSTMRTTALSGRRTKV